LALASAVADRLYTQLQAGGGPAPPPVYLLDGSTLTTPHTPALVAAFPPAHNQCGPNHWPLVRVVVAHELHTGLAVRPAWGAYAGPDATSEQALAATLLARLPVPGTVVADRNFGVFSVAWAIAASGHQALVRLTTRRGGGSRCGVAAQP
jgi:hypothetical protein